jgi:ADP-ribosyltransferase exoenzyme
MSTTTEVSYNQQLINAIGRSIQTIRVNDPCSCTKTLDDEHIAAIFLYTTEQREYCFHRINQVLSSNSELTGVTGHQITLMDAGLSRLPSFQGLCFRTELFGGRIHEKVKTLFASGVIKTPDDVIGVFTEFFMSTSLDKGLNLYPNEVTILIASKHAGKGIEHMSYFPEREVLFQRDARFLITEFTLDKSSCQITLVEA